MLKFRFRTITNSIFGQCTFFNRVSYCPSMSLLSFTRTRGESDDEEALISSLAHSTLTHALPSIKRSASGPVCSQKKALLIGIQYYSPISAQLDGEDRLDTPAGGQLKGPHVDVQNMRQLLLGEAFRCYHSHGFLRSDYFYCQIVITTNQVISLCLLTTAIPNTCSPRKRTS